MSGLSCFSVWQKRLCLLVVIWSSECASSSTAPSSSSGSSRRMPGNTPAVRATASVSRPRHRPTWLFSVSVTVATKWRGRGGQSELCEEENSSSSMEAACVGGCCSIWQRCSHAGTQSNLLEFQGQTWQMGARPAYLTVFFFLTFWANSLIFLSRLQPHSWKQRWRREARPQTPFLPCLFFLNPAPPKWNGDLPARRLWPTRAKSHSWPSDVSSPAPCTLRLICSQVAAGHWLLHYSMRQSWGIHSTTGSDFITGLKCSRP